MAGDRPSIEEVVGQIKQIEGDQGTLWRFYEASFLIGEAGRAGATISDQARQDATDLVDGILSRRSDWWGGFMLQGRLAELAGKSEDAARDYLQAIELGANQPEFARRLVGLLYQLKQIDQIDQVVQKLAAPGMALDELTLATAVNALHRKEFDRAITVARAVIPESTSNYFDLLFLSRILLAAGRTAEAEKPLRRAIELAPAMPEVWVSKARFWSRLIVERIAQVLKLAAHALPKEQVLKTLAMCQTIVGNDDEAGRLFQSALAEQPDDPMTLRLAAEHYVKVMQLEKVKPLLARLLDPRTKSSAADVAWANRARGLVHMSSGDRGKLTRLWS